MSPLPLRVASSAAPLAGSFVPPGDKSITHRAILLGLIAEGVTTIANANPGEDCAASLACAEALGARVTRGPSIAIQGAGPLTDPGRALDCGNSGTTLRLLAGILAAQPFTSTLTGDSSLRQRPVDRIVEPLRRMGARLSAHDGDRLPPLAIEGGALVPIHYVVPMASAQVATCVLLAGLHATGITTVEIPGPARDHTERMLPAFGVPVQVEHGPDSITRISVAGRVRPRGTALRVAGDFSAAAFFLAAAAARPGARVTALGVSLNPTRTGLLRVLERMGALIERSNLREEGGEPVGDVTVRGPESLSAFDVPDMWLPSMIDEVPAWTIAAAGARGVSRLTGARELRFKESDRLAALAENLSRLGVRVEESPDGLAITGGAIGGGTVSAHHDHRIAMAFAVLGTSARAPVTIDDGAAIATSYPGFTAALRALGGEVRGE